MKIMIKRKPSKKILVKNVEIGGGSSIKIQSMCNIKTADYKRIINQIRRLFLAGCELIRVSVKDDNDIEGLKKIIPSSPIPVIADIHFDYKLALKSIAAGVHKLRVNPGNIGDDWKVKEIIKAAKEKKIPIRIGVNFGSLEKPLLKKIEENKMTAESAVVASALKEIKLLEELDFTDIAVSLKTSDALTTVLAYVLFSEKRNYPLHVGITETGTLRNGLVKSSIGISQIFLNGLGDTVRVSLASDPIEEIYAAYNILKVLHLREDMVDFIACPTCGRTEINLLQLAAKVEKIVYSIRRPVKIAVMGCVVNGPGEARDADIGITGGKGVGLIFRKGKIIKKVKESELFDEFKNELIKMGLL